MWGAFFIVVALVLYLVPTFVAYSRKHKSADAIFILNLLLGWTLLGWIIAVVWAHTGNVATSDPLVRCPECRELIIKGARKCKHCGASLVAKGAPTPAPVPASMRACPDCQRLAPKAEKYCPSCGHAMQS